MQRYMAPLLTLIEEGKIDPAFVITHRLFLEQAPLGYDIFRKKDDACIKVVMKPQACPAIDLSRSGRRTRVDVG